MTPLKRRRAFAEQGLLSAPKFLLEDLIDSQADRLRKLTSKQLAAVIKILDNAYSKGIDSLGDIRWIGDSLYIGYGVDKAFTLSELDQISGRKFNYAGLFEEETQVVSKEYDPIRLNKLMVTLKDSFRGFDDNRIILAK